MKYAKDRKRWRHWLFEAGKRSGLCVLDYIITSNHIYLLVRERGQGKIKNSMPLVAGLDAEEYNQRKGRKGAFREFSCHAPAVDSEMYLARCMVYIDLNMVHAGVVSPMADWLCCGYCEFQSPLRRKHNTLAVGDNDINHLRRPDPDTPLDTLSTAVIGCFD